MVSAFRFWKVSLYAVDDMRADLYGYGHRRDDTIVRAPGSSMRSRNGLQREGLANGFSDAR